MSEKILVFDDERLVATAVEKALSRVGYSVAKVHNLKELDKALKSAPYDLFITDVNLEEDSLDNIIERVRRTSPGVKVMKMSGSLGEDGSDDFIEKPFDINDLRAKVRVILHGIS